MTCIVTSEQYFKAVDEINRIVLGHELDCDFGYDPGMSDETVERLLELEHIVEVYEEQNQGMLEAMSEEEI